MVEWFWWDWSLSQWPTGFLQCFDAVGWVVWPVKIVPKITYKVSSRTLSFYLLTLYLLYLKWTINTDSSPVLEHLSVKIDTSNVQILLQSFTHQEITGLRSRLFSGQFSGSINFGTSWECRFNGRVTWHQRYAGAPSCWKMISLSEIWWMSGSNLLKTFSQ